MEIWCLGPENIFSSSNYWSPMHLVDHPTPNKTLTTSLFVTVCSWSWPLCVRKRRKCVWGPVFEWDPTGGSFHHLLIFQKTKDSETHHTIGPKDFKYWIVYLYCFLPYNRENCGFAVTAWLRLSWWSVIRLMEESAWLVAHLVRYACTSSLAREVDVWGNSSISGWRAKV